MRELRRDDGRRRCVCGTVFVPRRRSQTHCHPRCRVRAHRSGRLSGRPVGATPEEAERILRKIEEGR